MKKFFKDVIGEIRNPSEDAGRVSDVIRRVIRVALFMSILFHIISLSWSISSILNMHSDGYFADYIKYSENGLFGFIFPYAKSFLRLILNIMLFIICNKSVKRNTLVKSKLFLIILATLLLLYFTSFNFNIHSILGLFFNLTISASIYGIIYFAFWDIKDDKSISMELNKKRMRMISILGYALLVLHLTKQTINMPFYYLSHFRAMLTYTGVTIWEWFVVIAIVLDFIVFSGLILLLIFSLIGRTKELSRVRKKSNLLIIMLFISILEGFLQYFILDGGYFYFIVFALAVSYQNKYKVFDNLGQRIFKNTIQKIKTGFNKYLSFKE